MKMGSLSAYLYRAGKVGKTTTALSQIQNRHLKTLRIYYLNFNSTFFILLIILKEKAVKSKD